MNVPETFFTVDEQLALLGFSCAFGAALGVIYDIFRSLRIIFPHNTALVIIEDIIFTAIYVVFIISFTSAAARGEFRFYYILGNAAGFALYIFTVGSFIIAAVRKTAGTVRAFFNAVISPFINIYVSMHEKASAKFVRNHKNSAKHIKISKMLLLKPALLMYNKKDNKEERT